MKRIVSLLAVCASALLLTNCTGTAADSDTTPFIGKIEFNAKVMGQSTGGSVTIDAEKKQVTYRIDAIKDFLGMDIVTMVDMENNVTYSISPSKKVYMKMDIPRKDMKGELPSKKEVEEMKEEFFSKLKATGKEMEISGYTCAEYEIIEKVEDLENATVWVSKSLLDRLAPLWGDFPEIADLGIEEMLIGFPLKAEGKADGQTFSLEVTKITEGADVLTDLDLKGMEELDQSAFMMRVMDLKDNPFAEMLEGLEGLEDLDIDLDKSIKDLKEEINTEDMEKLLEQLQSK